MKHKNTCKFSMKMIVVVCKSELNKKKGEFDAFTFPWKRKLRKQQISYISDICELWLLYVYSTVTRLHWRRIISEMHFSKLNCKNRHIVRNQCFRFVFIDIFVNIMWKSAMRKVWVYGLCVKCVMIKKEKKLHKAYDWNTCLHHW